MQLFTAVSNRQLYCGSAGCKPNYKKRKPPHKPLLCRREKCGKSFTPKHGSQVYCTKRCGAMDYEGYDIVETRILRCAYCWREFESKRGNLAYCSEKCRVEGQVATRNRLRIKNRNDHPDFYGFRPRDTVEFRLWFRESYYMMGIHSLSGVYPCFDYAETFGVDKNRFHMIACYQVCKSDVANRNIRSIWEYTRVEPRVYTLSPFFVLYRKFLESIDTSNVV